MGSLRAISIVVLLASLALAREGVAGELPLSIGDPAPDWILANSQDDYISFYKDSGEQPAVLLFWATWCQFCEELMPELNVLVEKYAKEGVKFYAINIWEDGDPIAHMAKHGFAFTLLLQGDMVAKRYGVNGTPGLMVVDEDKIIRYVRPYGLSAEEVCDQVESVLDKQLEQDLARSSD